MDSGSGWSISTHISAQNGVGSSASWMLVSRQGDEKTLVINFAGVFFWSFFSSINGGIKFPFFWLRRAAAVRNLGCGEAANWAAAWQVMRKGKQASRRTQTSKPPVGSPGL